MRSKITKESAEDFLMSQLEVHKTKEDLILAFWLYWVDSVTITAVEFQKVLACSSVNKWFMIELEKEETEFDKIIETYPDTSGKDKDWLYCKYISRLMSKFPKALLDFAKKHENKEQAARIPGLKIEIQIAKLN
ncbi:hypothetical protein GJU43_13905 [Flavobacterium sp. LC2016-23]|uniref:hypothetical protein n=1 Tax=Flavobacterium sp. LC2016-23 TaxID=2666330 RepID=UPI0012B035D4|nr:hypothetical protein [Flavobacterium sp. LC2016-23]MRX40377.1 hypothetical protein [Flavobacterium sp. LC2016-23]